MAPDSPSPASAEEAADDLPPPSPRVSHVALRPLERRSNRAAQLVDTSQRASETFIMRVVWQDARSLRASSSLTLQPDVVARVLDASAVLTATLDPDLDLEPTFSPNALTKGDVCVGVFASGMLASYGWYARTRTEVAFGVHIGWSAPRTRYMYKGFTRSSHRGRGLYPVVLRAAAHLLDDTDSIFALIRRGNTASFNAAVRAGYEAEGTCAVTAHFGARGYLSSAARERGLVVTRAV